MFNRHGLVHWLPVARALVVGLVRIGAARRRSIIMMSTLLVVQAKCNRPVAEKSSKVLAGAPIYRTSSAARRAWLLGLCAGDVGQVCKTCNWNCLACIRVTSGQ